MSPERYHLSSSSSSPSLENNESDDTAAKVLFSDILRVQTRGLEVEVTFARQRQSFWLEEESKWLYEVKGRVHDDKKNMVYEFSVRRSLSDFRSLAKLLPKALPGFFIPSLQVLGFWKGTFAFHPEKLNGSTRSFCTGS